MKTAVVVFPGSNCDKEMAAALHHATGVAPQMVWHSDTTLPEVDLIALPGGFSYGDYLRTGAMAAHSPIMREVIAAAARGVRVLGVCNGFQILCEAGLLPGALLRNSGLRFICRSVTLRVENNNNAFVTHYQAGQELHMPIAHGEGNYFAAPDELQRLEDEGRVIFRYIDNPNGSANDIAGITSAGGNVLGMMPHPERVTEKLHGCTDGAALFSSVAIEAVK